MVNLPQLIKLIDKCDDKNNGADVYIKMYGDGSGCLMGVDDERLAEWDETEEIEESLKEYLKNG